MDRLETMKQGNQYLRVWLSDQVRQGLASLQAQPEQYWEDFAALMVDHKLGGIARRIHKIKSYLSSQHNVSDIMDEFAEIYLFCRGFDRIHVHSDAIRSDLLQIGGVSFRKEEIIRNSGLEDYWLILGTRTHAEEKLQVRRTWLLGEESARFAMILDFSWGTRSWEVDYIPGSAFRGEIVFYPGALPLRGLVKHSKLEARGFKTPAGHHCIHELVEDHTIKLTKNPWLRSYPYLLTDVVPVKKENEEEFRLVDKNLDFIVFAGKNESAAWKVFALGGMGPVDVFGEWDGEQLLILSAFKNDRLVIL